MRIVFRHASCFLVAALISHAAAAQDTSPAYYDASARALCLKAGSGFKCSTLPRESAVPVYFDFREGNTNRGAAFFSPAFYRSYREKNPGVSHQDGLALMSSEFHATLEAHAGSCYESRRSTGLRA